MWSMDSAICIEFTEARVPSSAQACACFEAHSGCEEESKTKMAVAMRRQCECRGHCEHNGNGRECVNYKENWGGENEGFAIEAEDDDSDEGEG